MAIRLFPGDLAQAAEIIRQGGLVAFPTETVYGLGANAFNAAAVARVFEAKERPSFDPLIVHVTRGDVSGVADGMNDLERQLMRRFWPGPLTIVLPKVPALPELVTAGLPKVGVRCPAHLVAESLIRMSNCAIAAPSANRFGGISPTTADHVLDQLGDRIDAVIDGGPCQVGLESTVVEVREGRIVVLRLGGITVEALSEIVATEIDIAHVDSISQSSPGRLARHYAPTTPLEVRDLRDAPGGADVGALAFRGVPEADRFRSVEVLSQSGSLVEAAANFFSALRRLDAAGLRLIVAEWFPDEGLGRALNDRLRRASRR